MIMQDLSQRVHPLSAGMYSLLDWAVKHKKMSKNILIKTIAHMNSHYDFPTNKIQAPWSIDIERFLNDFPVFGQYE